MLKNSLNKASLQIARDRRLVKALLKGDDRAFKTFTDTYFPKLYRYAIHRLRDPHKVEDVIQAALIKAARRIETFRGESTLLTWLTQICRHEISQHLTKNQQHEDCMLPFLNDDILKSVVESMESADKDTPEAICQRDELISLIQFSLDQLPDRYATALEMKYIQGYSSKQIADHLNIGDDATQSLLARARQAFREVSETALSAFLVQSESDICTSEVTANVTK